MVDTLRAAARDLLSTGKVQVVIGYGEGTRDCARAVFVRDAGATSTLIFDERCTGNLAVYLTRPEIRGMGNLGIVAPPAVVRSIVQLAAERQLEVSTIVTLAVDGGSVTQLADVPSLEAFAAAHPVIASPGLKTLGDAIARMGMEERRSYWDTELARCFKCYACRAVCPLCYCERCITDANQPQWVCVAPHAMGIVEWHLNRAMHLAGRCVQCEACSAACPVGIPIGLLTAEATRGAEQEFGHRAGISCAAPAALSSFRLEDKESFIV